MSIIVSALGSASPCLANARLSFVRRSRRQVSTAADFHPLFSVSPSPKLSSAVRRLPFLYRAPSTQICHSFSSAPAFVSVSSVFQDAAATVIVLAGANALVFTFDTLTRRNLIEQSLSRKLVHILSGLLFMVSWPIFSNSTDARYFASLVPFLNCLKLVVYGLSLATDKGLIKSVTRGGNPEELLKGPLYYVMMLVLCALFFWRDSPIGVIALAMMCGGDGVADIMGRSFGSMKIPYNQQKSWAGSISMFVFGFLISIGMLYYFSVLGYFQLDWTMTMRRVVLVSLVATVVESLSTTETVDDNISVPVASMVAAYLSFGFL